MIRPVFNCQRTPGADNGGCRSCGRMTEHDDICPEGRTWWEREADKRAERGKLWDDAAKHMQDLFRRFLG